MRAIFCALLLVLCGAAGARAQDYPTRNVTFVVPTGPGAATDLLARILAPQLGERLGKPFVVEDKPGAGTLTASNAVAKATPDGYTILMGTSTPLAINATLYKHLPYDPATDFVPLALIARIPFVLVVNNDLPVHSVPELIAYAKAHPGALSYGSTGPGTPFHLNGALFSAMTGIEMVHVPYKAVVDAQVDLMGGRIQVMFTDFTSSVPLIEDGKMRALGVTTKTPAAAMPELKPIAELGVPGFEAAAWQMVAAPSATPRPIVDKLHDTLETIMALPQTQESITKIGLIPAESATVERLQAFVRSEIVRWGEVVKRSGASVD